MKKASTHGSVVEKAMNKSMAKSGMAVEGSPEEEKGETPKFEQHEIDHAADTIMRAHEHMANPALMKHVHKVLDKKKKAIRSLDDLRRRADELQNG